MHTEPEKEGAREKEREREIECVCVCVCVHGVRWMQSTRHISPRTSMIFFYTGIKVCKRERERERESVCACMCVLDIYVRRWRLFSAGSRCDRERMGVCVCVCVCVYMHVVDIHVRGH